MIPFSTKRIDQVKVLILTTYLIIHKKLLLMKKSYAWRLLPLIVLSLCFALPKHVQAQDTLKNLPELSLPLTSNKLVIAHCMTHIIRYSGHGFEDGCNPAYYPVSGNASAAIGGYTQVNVMSDKFYKDSTLDQAVEFEMRSAMKAGIDGFQFYYVLGNNSWDDIIKAYFRVADAKNLDYWLRTPDGRMIMYLWYGEKLATIPANPAYADAFYVARAFRKLGNAIGEKIACVLAINDVISNTDLDAYLDYLPAVWLWTGGYTVANMDASIAAKCAARNRAYTGSVFNDFYTSKVLAPGTWDIQSVSAAVAAGIKNIERKHMVVGLSETFRKQLEFAVSKNVPIINVITWNDYPEGHHMAPEVNHNYGFAVLLNHYKNIWKGQASPYNNRDVAIAFFKKYKNGVVPDPYKINSINIGSSTSSNYEDSIEVVTIMTSPGQLVVNGKTVTVPAGLTSTRFPYIAGAVKVSIYRNGVLTKDFTTPEWITNNPVRTDRLTYTFDSEYYRQLTIHLLYLGQRIYLLAYLLIQPQGLLPGHQLHRVFIKQLLLLLMLVVQILNS
ncbi:MAG: hypothetical protein HY305_04530 [Sphingobacteriales bacterium]|nr:hypothetical protein [Sphingobacteriales bacterium]